MRGFLVLGLAMVLAVVLAIPAAADPGVPSEGSSELKGIESADGGGTIDCPNLQADLDYSTSGYYMSRWDTLTGQVFAVENVHIDWVFTHPDGDTWVYRERGVSIVREGDDDLLYASNNGHHNHWLFGAHTGHRVFTATNGGSVHLEELIEAGQAFGNVAVEACNKLNE